MRAVRCEIQEIEYVYWRNVSLDISQIRIEYSNAGGQGFNDFCSLLLFVVSEHNLWSGL